MSQRYFCNTEQVLSWLQAANLLAYPTESVWGLGCDAFNEQAVRRLLTLKNRPVEKGLIVLTANTDLIQPFLLNLPNTRRDEILTTWDKAQTQATTWLLPLPKKLPKSIPIWITGGHDNLAVRVIKQPQITQLCQSLVSDDNPYGFLVSTSCNVSAQMPAKTLNQAVTYFDDYKYVGFLMAETLSFELPSQIRDAQTGQIIRH